MQAVELVNDAVVERSSSQSGKIYEAIPLIMAEIDAVGKNQINAQQKFKFRGIDDVYNAIQKVMAKHGVFNTAKIKKRERKEIISKQGTAGVYVLNEFIFRFYASDGSYVESEADGEALDYGDKASNKAASIAHKYALLQTFCIPTEDLKDPDAESHEIRPQHKQQPHASPPLFTGSQPQREWVCQYLNKENLLLVQEEREQWCNTLMGLTLEQVKSRLMELKRPA